jgi:tetratricopeptide (TPR) repeat protein
METLSTLRQHPSRRSEAPVKRTTQADLSRHIRTDWEARQFLVGIKRRMAGDHSGALRKMKRLLDRNPTCWPAVFEVATMGHVLCEHEFAAHHLRRLVKAVPGFLEGWYNLGTIVQCLGRYEEAETCLRQAIALDPDFTAAHTNLGNALLGLGRHDEAMTQFQESLKHSPQDAEANWNLAHVLVLTGQWEEGWAKYEYRWKIPGFVEMNAIAVDESRKDLPLPWRGADLRGKSLVVAEEQGYGDTLMCLRYAPILRDMGAEVTWAVRPEMMRLVEATVAPSKVCNIREAVPASDYIVAAMTLHHRLGITPETVPGAEGYLRRAA